MHLSAQRAQHGAKRPAQPGQKVCVLPHLGSPRKGSAYGTTHPFFFFASKAWDHPRALAARWTNAGEVAPVGVAQLPMGLQGMCPLHIGSGNVGQKESKGWETRPMGSATSCI